MGYLAEDLRKIDDRGLLSDYPGWQESDGTPNFVKLSSEIVSYWLESERRIRDVDWGEVWWCRNSPKGTSQKEHNETLANCFLKLGSSLDDLKPSDKIEVVMGHNVFEIIRKSDGFVFDKEVVGGIEFVTESGILNGKLNCVMSNLMDSNMFVIRRLGSGSKDGYQSLEHYITGRVVSGSWLRLYEEVSSRDGIKWYDY